MALEIIKRLDLLSLFSYGCAAIMKSFTSDSTLLLLFYFVNRNPSQIVKLELKFLFRLGILLELYNYFQPLRVSSHLSFITMF